MRYNTDMSLELHNHLIDKLAFFNGIVSGIALYPQVYVVLTTGSAEGISLTTFIMILVNSIVWLAYAFHRGLISLGIASLLNAVASGILVAVALWH